MGACCSSDAKPTGAGEGEGVGGESPNNPLASLAFKADAKAEGGVQTLDSPTSPIDKHAPPTAERGEAEAEAKAKAEEVRIAADKFAEAKARWEESHRKAEEEARIAKRVAAEKEAARLKEEERVEKLSKCHVEELDDKLEVFFVEIIPRTPRGSIDVKRCDHNKLRGAVKGANIAVSKRFEAAWNAYAQRGGSEVPMVKTLRETCGDLTNKFSGTARCALDADAGADALILMASRHGKKLLDLLEGVVTKAGGAYHRGPRKEKERILAKAKDDYKGDVACVVDVERATGVFDSLGDLKGALELLRGAHEGSLVIRRCKDCFFQQRFPNGYRDFKFNVEFSGTGFVGELQLHLRRIVQIKNVQHRFYVVERALENNEALEDAITGLGLQSEQVLRLIVEGGGSVLDVCGSESMLREALERAVPQGCKVANVYIEADGATCANVCLGVDDVSAIAKLRDNIILGSTFEDSLNDALGQAKSGTSRVLGLLFRSRVRVDRCAFMECYARMMMRFDKLTPHQREKLTEVRGAKVAVLLAPAGGGKTFVAIHRMLQVLQEDPSATILFVARNEALALFACKWLVVASRKKAEHVVERVHVLVAPFQDGPRQVCVDVTSGRPRLVFEGNDANTTKYPLMVVDEAHHLVGDSTLQKQLKAINAAASKLLFLGDASQATDTMRGPAEIARSLVKLPRRQKVVIATLSEVIRSTKRIVAGAAAFQLEAGRKADTSTHATSVGPPLVARIFQLADGDEGKRYAREVVDALAAVQRQLPDLDDLDDRVAVVCPDDEFVKMLHRPLTHALAGRFEIVDAVTASAALPRGDADVRATDSKGMLVVDRIENMDGLERLVVICVGLDQVIDQGSDVPGTRSRLYRAMTRAQLAVAVVNKALPGGWLEFLGRVELAADGGFDDAADRENRAETAADDVVNTVEATSATVARSNDVAVKDASPDDAVDAPAVKKKVTQSIWDARAVATAEAEPMKIVQSIWDASAVATASRGDLRFMPYFEGVDLSKLAELRTLQGHSHVVYGVAVFPDGRRVVSGSYDSTLKVWDIETGECVATLEGHSNSVDGVAVFPDGRRVVSGSYDNTLKVWDIETGECVATLEGHWDGVYGVAVFPDGRRVVSASHDKTLKVWDVATGDCVATLEGHSNDVNCVAISPDGRRVVSGSDDNTLKVWDVATGRCVATLEGHSIYVYGVAVFPDGRRVVSASHDKTLKVWDVATGDCVATLEGHSREVQCVAVSPDGRRIISGSNDTTLKVWDVATGECVATLEGHSREVQCVAISPDGRRVVSASDDSTLKYWGVPK